MAHGRVPVPYEVLPSSQARLAIPSWTSPTRVVEASAFLHGWMHMGSPQTMHQEALP